jgi:probable rRNA maturation factor
MRVELSISRKAECGLPKRFFMDVAGEALRLSFLSDSDMDATVGIGVALISGDEIRVLNRTYRKKDRPTDILSFPGFPKRTDIVTKDGRVEIGDLVLDPSYIRLAAAEDGVSFETEMAFIFSHGVFHLLGYRHGRKMFSMQEAVASTYGDASGIMKQTKNL